MTNDYENNYGTNNMNNQDFTSEKAKASQSGFGEDAASYTGGSSQGASQQEEASHNAYGSQGASQDGTYHYTGAQIPDDETYMGGSQSGAYGGYGSRSAYGGYSNNSQNTSYGNNSNPYGAYGSQSYGTPYTAEYGSPQQPPKKQKARKVKKAKLKKEKKPVSRGALAAILVICILFSGALGFGGGYAATRMFGGDSGVTVNQNTQTAAPSEASGSAAAPKGSASGLSTTDIVNKTADSVVEITTETVTTGSFFQQYVSQGAGSGVIISEDGYILTNNHVIDGANTVKVTLRDSAEYDAKVIGADSKIDIALLKIEETGLSAATFGDSSTISVGDYAVVIGNPLGQLGGTVTDGIISALGRDVIIDGETMSLMQTNAAINPGNSGGGLFNSNGELIGIICAKASGSGSDTEVEGLGFAIPINDVLDILNDLKQYGYVQGRIDLGMTLSDVTSNTGYTPGVYVSGVTQGSNAQKAGFQAGDLITGVNGTEVTTASDINAIIEQLNVGDNVKFSVTRGTQSGELTLTLEEYNPNNNSLTNNSRSNESSNGGSIWDYFNW